MTDDQPMPCERCGEPHARCSAHTRAGKACTQWPMAGQRVCRMHGGSSPKAIAAAERARREAEAEQLVAKVFWAKDATPITDPFGEMQLLAGQMRQAVDMLGAMLGPGDPCSHCGRAPLPLDTPAGVAWLKQQRELRGLLEAMGRLGIASRAVEVQQGQADLMLTWLRAGLEAGTAVVADASRQVVLEAVLEGFLSAMRRSRAGAVVAELEAGTGAASRPSACPAAGSSSPQRTAAGSTSPSATPTASTTARRAA